MIRNLAACTMLLFSNTGLAHTQVFSGSISGGPGIVTQGPSGVISGVLPGSGVISGSVVDERGAPVTRVTVHVIGPPMATPDGRTVEMTRSMPTDEGGRFRIDRLPAQSYLIAVAPMTFFSPQRPGTLSRPVDNQPLYALTYFPGVIDRAQAQAISVVAGAEQTVFIELQRVQPVHIRGTVSSPSGRSTSGVQIYLQRTIGSSGSSSQAGYVQDDGSFDITATPGVYTVMASVSPGTAGTEFATADVQTTGDNVEGVALVLGTGGSVRGQIVFDGPAPGNAPLGATVFLAPVPGGPMMMGRAPGQVSVAEDWTFEAKGLYGTYRFSAPMMLMPQYRAVRVECDGRDIGNNGVDIRAGEHQIVLHLAPIRR